MTGVSRRLFMRLMGMAPVAAPVIGIDMAAGNSIAGFARGGLVSWPSPRIVRTRHSDEVLRSIVKDEFSDEVSKVLSKRRFESLFGNTARNTPSLFAKKKYLEGLPERISRERSKAKVRNG